jgi:hypothetical protein
MSSVGILSAGGFQEEQKNDGADIWECAKNILV